MSHILHIQIFQQWPSGVEKELKKEPQMARIRRKKWNTGGLKKKRTHLCGLLLAQKCIQFVA